MSGSCNKPFESEDAVRELAPVSGDIKVSISVNSSLTGSNMHVGETVRVSDSSAIDYRGADEDRVLESRACEIKIERLKNASDDDSQEAGSVDKPIDDAQNVSIGRKKIEGDYDSMLSMFDQFASNGKPESVGHGYEIGDMVWGKVKSHPWWPGQIFNEALASSSVRKSKSEGNFLVAFFGDSSYGWFDPAELVPFEPYFAEKSKQTSSRTFVKAVEEGLEEVNRRQALGLVCKCRKQFNLRHTDAKGYLAVDIGDYESGVYSINQIKKAREGFQPEAMLKFVKQLAVAPTSDDFGTIDLMKNKSTVLTFRKAVFEEFDETYAQAFGAQPVRPAAKSATREQSRVPLSGRLVFAETGKGKSSVKPNKMKGELELDKYVFKRRDEPNGSKTHKIIHGQTVSSSQPLQKMGSVIPSKGNQTAVIDPASQTSVSRMADFPEQSDSQLGTPEELGQREPVRDSVVTKGKLAGVGSKPKNEGGKKKAKLVKPPTEELTIEGSVPKIKKRKKLMGTQNLQTPGIAGKGGALGGRVDGKPDDVSSSAEELNVEGSVPKIKKRKKQIGTEKSSDNLQTPGTAGRGGALGRRVDGKPDDVPSSAEELNIEGSVPKIKKRKKQIGPEKIPVNLQTPGTAGKGGALGKRVDGKPDDEQSPGDNSVTGKGGGKAGPVGEKPAEVLVNNSDVTDDIVPDHDANTPVPELLSELRALALNPSAGTGKSYPEKLVQAFLRFRSVVYLKSSSSEASAEGESNEARGMSVDNNSDTTRGIPSVRPPKPPVRREDPSKGGRKRGPSDRQEEMFIKKKKISDMKSLALEKKAAQRAPEVQRDGKEAKPTAQTTDKKFASKHQAVDGREMARKPMSKAFGKVAKAADPTILIMKFPVDSALPSPAELKVKFARFGPLDHSGTRIFWKSSTIRLVYLYRNDAQAALKFATASSNLFGNTNVRCQLREVESSEMEPKVEPSISISSQMKDPPPVLQRPGQNLKSILKKPAGDEGGSGNGNGNSSKGRVKFMLGDEGSVKTSSDEGASASSHGLKNNSEKIKMAIPPPLPMPSVIPVSIPNSPIIPPNKHHHQHAEFVPPPPPPPPLRSVIPAAQPRSDISQQMISLLTKCKDVVTGLTGELGYVPYHPL